MWWKTRNGNKGIAKIYKLGALTHFLCLSFFLIRLNKGKEEAAVCYNYTLKAHSRVQSTINKRRSIFIFVNMFSSTFPRVACHCIYFTFNLGYATHLYFSWLSNLCASEWANAHSLAAVVIFFFIRFVPLLLLFV